ncbi:FK506-binding protein 3-like [Diadema antillarum]|uniref:FK506-binding protein 3-like n=1 Tax=Diadema antillarum TaxID=105358 RepID=UPI003A862F4B
MTYHFNGTYENGESFNATAPGIPVNLTLGTLIQGLNSGLSGACVGQTRKIFIPHQLGYDDDAEAGTNGNAIPPHTDVIFLVKVINIFPFETEVITSVYENTTDFALIDGQDNLLENDKSNEGDNNDSKRPLRNHPRAIPHHSRPFWWYLQFLAIPVLIILLVVDAYYLYKIYFPHGRVKFYKVRDHEPNDIVSTL